MGEVHCATFGAEIRIPSDIWKLRGETMSKKVLVVDDEEMIREFLSLHLPKWGYEVKEAIDGIHALERLAKEDFNLIICDIVMPNMNGWQLLGKIRENPKTKDVPFIVLTAKDEDSDMLRGYRLGASYYITKPFDIVEILSGIQMMSRGDSESKNYLEMFQESDDTEEQGSADLNHR
jgi:DNA-binding response OmpR family regulator